MKDAELVRRGEPICYLNSGRQHQLQAGRTLVNHLIQRLAWNVLHDDVRFVLAARVGGSFAYVIDRADVWVVDSRGQASFAELRGANLLDRQRAPFEQLEDD